MREAFRDELFGGGVALDLGVRGVGAEQERAVATVLDKHTSTEQVGAVAQAAGVGTLVLTHLVPASVPTERWERAVSGFDGRVVVGQDLLEIDVAAH